MKRAIDVVLGTVLLAGSAPFWPLIALLIAVTSEGPVLFRQARVGHRGVPFDIIKFRTMRVGTHDEIMRSDVEFTTYAANGFKLRDDDPRITRVGRFLRRTSLDELPQLINVVRGEMSLVGIRPLIEVELAARSRRDRLAYQAFRPGITGLWQVRGRSSFIGEEREVLDRRYVDDWSIGLDLRLLALTPFAALRFAKRTTRGADQDTQV